MLGSGLLLEVLVSSPRLEELISSNSLTLMTGLLRGKPLFLSTQTSNLNSPATPIVEPLRTQSVAT
ncbi:hypothetical protein [Chroococcidiopsis cubana]|uniref:hypothetical protein n=1 Tax=Chroococcidiopsis cubana TaxID=171392 RepID=UPI002159A97D|nr:hypothetical protein [Chroococcidiopsis cubana]